MIHKTVLVVTAQVLRVCIELFLVVVRCVRKRVTLTTPLNKRLRKLTFALRVPSIGALGADLEKDDGQVDEGQCHGDDGEIFRREHARLTLLVGRGDPHFILLLLSAAAATTVACCGRRDRRR